MGVQDWVMDYLDMVISCSTLNSYSTFLARMGFRIDVNGMEEVQKALDESQKGLDHHTFDEWVNRIENTAKRICNDTDSKRIKLKPTQELGFNFEAADKEAIDCLINAIKQHLNLMPPTLQKIYKTFMEELEGKKHQESTKSE